MSAARTSQNFASRWGVNELIALLAISHLSLWSFVLVLGPVGQWVRWIAQILWILYLIERRSEDSFAIIGE